ncbi:MAG: T9SS type A sorting domain-containing protein [Flavobacteriales bacterium]|nr:T9SS type A sorting domain-containing protein [Flavobacteriales bacterium]
MRKTQLLSLLFCGAALPMLAQQRYLEEVFTDADVMITSDVIYGVNIDFMPPSNPQDPNAPAEIQQLQTLVSTQQPIPPEFFDPMDNSTVVKVRNMRMDIYEPDQFVDTVSARPVVLYIHTGNALPPPLNGSPNGTKTDSCAVEICKQMAKRGYVAVSMAYRHGWNPLAATEEERRGQLLNAIYRAVHDVRQCLRTLKADAAGVNSYAIDPNKIVLLGEGTGGYIAQAQVTLDDPAELFIEKFRPDPFDPNVSYIDTTLVGNLDGLNGLLTLYRDNGFDHDAHFCVNLGGALADTSWLAPGDAPMVSFHTVFDPFAPFTEGIVIVPTTGGPVVPVQGSNMVCSLATAYGNNNPFVNMLGGDPFTDAARALYGQTIDGVTINSMPEGLFPVVRPRWPAPALDEASPWQWWDPMSPIAQVEVAPGVTAHQASLASNPDMMPSKGRAYIDTIMGYMNPRIVCALQLGPCNAPPVPDCLGVDNGPALPGWPCDDMDPNTINDTWNANCECMGIVNSIEENDPVALGISIFPTPATDLVTIVSEEAVIVGYTIFDINGRRVRQGGVNADRFVLERKGLEAGAYLVQLTFEQGALTRMFVLE